MRTSLRRRRSRGGGRGRGGADVADHFVEGLAGFAAAPEGEEEAERDGFGGGRDAGGFAKARDGVADGAALFFEETEIAPQVGGGGELDCRGSQQVRCVIDAAGVIAI